MRRAMPADRDAIGRLWQELMEFHAHLDPGGFTPRPDALPVWLEWLDKLLAAGDAAVFVAEVEGQPVGYIIGGTAEKPPVYPDRRYGVVHDTCVTADWRRRGVGQWLFKALLEWFREQGLSEVRVGAAAANQVSNVFWQAMGFRPHVISMRRAVDL